MHQNYISKMDPIVLNCVTRLQCTVMVTRDGTQILKRQGRSRQLLGEGHLDLE